MGIYVLDYYMQCHRKTPENYSQSCIIWWYVGALWMCLCFKYENEDLQIVAPKPLGYNEDVVQELDRTKILFW